MKRSNPSRCRAATAALAFAIAVAGAAHAVEETPMEIAGGTMVTTDKAKALFDAGATFIDARVANEYAEEHIKGAKNVLYKETFPKVARTDPADTFDVAKLPADKGTAMVFYCNGSPCWKGYKGAAEAIKAGYQKINWYRDGIPAWKAAGYPVE
jgi:rhodanese-related sulfurtransferase